MKFNAISFETLDVEKNTKRCSISVGEYFSTKSISSLAFGCKTINRDR